MIASKQEMVYQKIKNHILIGKLKNNSRITERGLAEKLNVTRVPVRESLVKLEQDGLIKKIPSKGYIVENYSVEELEEALLMRFVIECQAASEAAQAAAPEDIIELKNLNEALKNAGHAGNIDAVVESDREFHFGIVKASRSKVLNKMYSIISIPVFHHRQEINMACTALTVEAHNEIIKTIENKDKARAFTLAFLHTPGRDRFKKNFYGDAVQKILNNELNKGG
jgi:DNA-binding GntR family transcriptional regulator